MPDRSRLESAGLIAAALVCVAFIVSFAVGLGRPGQDTRHTATDPAATPAAPPAAGRVEVLNGSGRSGMARAVTQRLRDAGFDVVFFGNASAAADSSTVYARVDDDAVARAVAAELGITRVLVQRDTSLFLDATIVLGSDWPARSPRQ